MKLHLYILAAFALTLNACEKTIELDVNQVEEKVVIDALLTDRPSLNYVKVSKSVGFYASGKTPRITDATVSVEDSDGNIYNYVHYAGSHEDSIGFYFPEIDFAGVPGKSYKLTVVAEGETYEAQDTMNRLVAMEKLEYRINEDEFEDPEDPGRFYELLLFVKEPQDTRDYYLFKSVRNGKVEYATETDIYYSDDELIGENVDGVPLPLFYSVGDVAGVQVYSLTRNAFIFYRDLQKLLTNDGGMFGPPPANPRSNLSNGAIGLFQVSAIQTGELQITE